LPLESLSEDPGQEYFADGMTDALIADLAKISGLKVISRTSVMRYKGARKPLGEIANELGVDTVVEGTVLSSGGQVRINAQLIDAPTDEHLWAESYQRELRDVLMLQSEVARAVSRCVKAVVTPEEEQRLTVTRTITPASHDAYLRGLYHFHRNWDATSFAQAFDFFRQAIDVDPTNAAAYAALANSYILRGVLGQRHPSDCFPQAKVAAGKALEIDEKIGEAHHALGVARFLYERAWHDVEPDLRRAYELNSSDITTLEGYGFCLCMMGRFEEAIDLVQRAVELDPLTCTPVQHLAFILFVARRFDESLAKASKALEIEPGFPYSRMIEAWILQLEGRRSDAIEAAEAVLEIPELQTDSYSRGTCGWVLARCGEPRRAEAVLEGLVALSESQWVDPTWIALLHEGLDDRDGALRWLRRAIVQRSPTATELPVFPLFDSIRTDERFAVLLKEIGR
jgi:TolB-like protein